jgi:hypothetical protein
MVTIQRILKCSPSLLLVVAWVAGLYGRLSATYNQPTGPSWTFESTSGNLGITHLSAESMLGGFPMGPKDGVEWLRFKKEPPGFRYAGTFKTRRHAVCTGGHVTAVQVPVPVVATACLPLALGALLSFRFRLWHYLAFTALLAVEFAYYLRWQG